MKDVLRQLDHGGVLSNMDWKSIFGTTQQPFSNDYEWWTKYNKIKHYLISEVHTVKFHHVMDAIVALESLHRLAVAKKEFNMSNTEILDSNNWEKDGFQRFTSNLELFMTTTTPKRSFEQTI